MQARHSQIGCIILCIPKPIHTNALEAWVEAWGRFFCFQVKHGDVLLLLVKIALCLLSLFSCAIEPHPCMGFGSAN